MISDIGTPKIGGVPRRPQDLALNQEFRLNMSMGMYPGYGNIAKFGENPDVDSLTAPEDIWEAGGLYTYDADGTAPIVSVISDDDADIGQPLEVDGLDIDGYFVRQYPVMNGTTRVALDTPLWRVYRMINRGVVGEEFAGTVYCYVGTGGVPAAGDIRAMIDDGHNQTLMCIYTVPRGKVAFIYRGEVGISRGVSAGEARCAYYARSFGRVFTIAKRINVSNSGSSLYVDERTFPDWVPALTDIRLTVESVSANDLGVWGTFDLLTVDQNLFSPHYLTMINQPYPEDWQ
jgi:hypothetical protein